MSVYDKYMVVEIDWVISSRRFIELSKYKETQGFDENYFVNRLDYHYCITVKELGYKVIKIKNAFLYQTLGEQGKGIFKSISKYSHIRHYYIFKNILYYYFKKRTPSFMTASKVGILSLKQIWSVIIFEEYKTKKIKMRLKGLEDYRHNNMGKYINLVKMKTLRNKDLITF